MPTNRLRLSPLDLPVALFLISAALAVVPAYDRSTAWTPLGFLLAGGVVYLLVSRLGRSAGATMRIAIGISVFGTLVALYFITQYPHYPGLDKVAVISSILDLIGRVTPNLAFWAPVGNSVATALEGLLFLAVGAGFSTQHRGLRWLLWVCAALMAAALVLTSSRGAWLAVGIAGLLWAALHFRPARWLGLAVLAGAVLLLALVVFNQDVTILDRIPVVNRTVAPLFIRPDRLDVYRGSLQLIRDVPLTGVGLGGQFAMHYSRYVLMIQVPFLEYSHNLYLEVWLQQGILGLAAWIWLAVAVAYAGWRVLRAGRDPLVEGVIIGLAATYLHGLTDARQYSDWWCWLPFFLLTGLAAAAFLRARLPSTWRQDLAPAAVMGLALLAISVTMPSLPAAWRANLGCLQQGQADLGATLNEEERAALREKAERNFRRAVALSPGERTPNLRLGLMLTEDEQFAEALPYLASAAASAPGNATAAKALGLGYVWNGEIDRAAEMLAPLPGMVNELNTWGWWRTSEDQVALARYAYETSLRMNPDQPEVQKLLDTLPK